MWSSSSKCSGMWPLQQWLLPTNIIWVKKVLQMHKHGGTLFLQNSICCSRISGVWYFCLFKNFIVRYSRSTHIFLIHNDWKKDTIQVFQDNSLLLVWATYDDDVELLFAQKLDTWLVQLFHHIGTSPDSFFLFGFYFHQHSKDYMLALHFVSKTFHYSMTWTLMSMKKSWTGKVTHSPYKNMYV